MIRTSLCVAFTSLAIATSCGGDSTGSTNGAAASSGSAGTASGGSAGAAASGGAAGTLTGGAGAGAGAGAGGAGPGGSGGGGTGGAGAGGAATGGGPAGSGGEPDAAVDAKLDVNADGPLGFLNVLDGVWLIGWSGGLYHYSWVRIEGAAAFGGSADFNDGSGLNTNGPYWQCNDTGTWSVTQKPSTIAFYFPTTCNDGGMEAITFESFQTPSGWPAGADLAASLSGTGAATEAYHFPPGQCDATMTTCADPL